MIKLITYESLFSTSADQSEFMARHETGVRKLSIFEQIRSEDCSEDEEEEDILDAMYDEIKIDRQRSQESSDDSTELESSSLYLSD